MKYIICNATFNENFLSPYSQAHKFSSSFVGMFDLFGEFLNLQFFVLLNYVTIAFITFSLFLNTFLQPGCLFLGSNLYDLMLIFNTFQVSRPMTSRQYSLLANDNSSFSFSYQDIFVLIHS